jgi:hypothetical protein
LTLVFLNYHAITPMDKVKANLDTFLQKPIGAGPFMFQEWKEDERVVLTANVNYWDGPPQVDTLIFSPIADQSAIMAELESGGIDIAAEVPPAAFSQIRSNANLQALTAPSTSVHYIGLNNKKTPLDNIKVRQALNLAVDKSGDHRERSGGPGRADQWVGANGTRVVARHLIPNVVAPVLVLATVEMGTVMISEAALSFLGLGVGASQPTWGGMLNDARQFLRQAWWLATFPGLAISVLVLAVNLLGDGLRDALDPRLRVWSN